MQVVRAAARAVGAEIQLGSGWDLVGIRSGSDWYSVWGRSDSDRSPIGIRLGSVRSLVGVRSGSGRIPIGIRSASGQDPVVIQMEGFGRAGRRPRRVHARLAPNRLLPLHPFPMYVIYAHIYPSSPYHSLCATPRPPLLLVGHHM